MVDVNAPWVLQEALVEAAPLRELELKWLEEPVWPPEDSAPRGGARSGVPVAMRENVLTPTDFARLIDCRAVDYIQPSVAKIGGISVMRDIYTLAEHGRASRSRAFGLFGPGLGGHRARHRRVVARRAGRAALLRSVGQPVRRLVRAGRRFLALRKAPDFGVRPRTCGSWTSCAWSEAMRSLVGWAPRPNGRGGQKSALTRFAHADAAEQAILPTLRSEMRLQ